MVVLYQCKIILLISLHFLQRERIILAQKKYTTSCNFWLVSLVLRFSFKNYNTKNLSQILHCKWNFVFGIAENVTEGLRWIDFIKNTCIWVVQCIQKRSMWWKTCLTLVSHQRLQLKLTSLKWGKWWLKIVIYV